MDTSANAALLAVDIGNHQIKLGIWTREPPEVVQVFRRATADPCFADLAAWLPAQRLQWCVATVQREAERRLAAWVAEHRTDDRYLLLHSRLLPIEIRVEQPERVGTDRLLAAVAVNALRDGDRPAIVIDAGTAITVDLVAVDGAFAGGVILPGFGLMARALARDTDLLPLVDTSSSEPVPPIVGTSTVAAIRSGLFWGSVGAVREIVQRMSAELGQSPQLFVAGGDAARLAPFLGESVRIVPELVLSGIARTWQFLARHAGSDFPTDGRPGTSPSAS